VKPFNKSAIRFLSMSKPMILWPAWEAAIDSVSPTYPCPNTASLLKVLVLDYKISSALKDLLQLELENLSVEWI
jgi:hypothetical protein